MGRMSYLDLPLEVRRRSAAKVRAKCMEALSDLSCSEDQAKKLADTIRQINQWENGTLKG